MKTLVLYYSLEENTKQLAEAIAEDLGADIERIMPKKEIRAKGISKFFWGGRQVILNKTPAIESLNSNFDAYDFIIVGSPVWAGTFAPAIKPVLSLEAVQDKKIAFFCTHEGGPGKVIEKFTNVAAANNLVVDGTDFLNDKKDILRHRETALQWAQTCISKIK